MTRKPGPFSVFAVVAVLVLLIGFGPNSRFSLSDNRGGAAGSPPADTVPAPGQGGKFVVWDKAELVKAYHERMEKLVESFGRQYGVETEYVTLNASELKTKLQAAFDAGNVPDLVIGDTALDKQFGSQRRLIEVSGLLRQLPLLSESLLVTQMGNAADGQYLIPQAFTLSGAYVRKDWWAQAALPLPATWLELREQARLLAKPGSGVYPLGLSLSANGTEGESLVRDVVLAWGGRFVDERNHVAVNTPATLEALQFLASLYTERLVPPEALSWDDAGNNNAYLRGQVGYIINTGSVYNLLEPSAPELYAATVLAPKPGGSDGSPVFGSGRAMILPVGGSNPAAAKRFVRELYEQPVYGELIESMGGTWQPVTAAGEDTAFWTDSANQAAGWLKMTTHVVGPDSYPGTDEETGAKGRNQKLGIKAVQRIIAGKMDAQRSLDELERELRVLYGS
ncbi:extracellular solute-binding protein [Paenibacillus athensensis]|nr:extracellular solute-binding protein [Paenibacillus athensensis]MCD1261448.1 extracellular solute-binding protein [Paenibacillus athensensis]